MHLIFGGAWQGKLRFATQRYHLQSEQIFTCTGTEIDFTCPCVTHLEEFVWQCLLVERDPVAYFREHSELWKGSVLICRDISSGVVPMGSDNRRWRDEVGRLCQYLSGCASQVSRIFCGLEERLK